MFFLSQISLHKSLQHEQRTDERGKLISSVPCSLSFIHTAAITCTHSCEGIQGDLSRFSFSLKPLNVSPLHHVWFCCSGSVHEKVWELLRAEQDADQKRGGVRGQFAAGASLAPGKGFVQNLIPLIITGSVQRIICSSVLSLIALKV